MVARGTLLLATIVLLWSPFAHAVDVWSMDEEFTYGYLIAPIALGVLWWRREELRRNIGKGHNAGLIIVGAAILLMLFSRRIGVNALGGIAVTPLLVGIAAYLWGWRAARTVAFPACFLIFGLGLYRGLLSSVGFILQQVTAASATWTGQHVGINVIRDGLVLHSLGSPSYAFVVAEACSGMSSLLSLLALAALWMYATRGRFVSRILVLMGVLPLVGVANTIRVTLVLAVAANFGQDAALGFFHGASSLVLFGLALGGLLALSRTVGCKLPTLATSY